MCVALTKAREAINKADQVIPGEFGQLPPVE